MPVLKSSHVKCKIRIHSEFYLEAPGGYIEIEHVKISTVKTMPEQTSVVVTVRNVRRMSYMVQFV